MCKSCDYNPCLKHCPETPAYPKTICICRYCEEPVYLGDMVGIFERGMIVIHENCLSEMSADELMEFIEIDIEPLY